MLPSEGNIHLFENGDANLLFGQEICQLFKSADFSIANLEGPLTDSNINQQKDGPSIKAPKTTIAGLKNLGLSAVALANNHITDYLQTGIDDTIDVLKKADIKYLGIVGKDFPATSKFISLEINGYKVCIYNVSETFFCSPTKDMSGANVYDEWIVLNDIKELKKKHDFLIVIYHGGAEYLPYPTPQTRKRFHRMADCGADFITAQHTHCIGCEEWYNGAYLLHGQGNFLFSRQKMFPSLTKQGLITEITINEDSFMIKHHVVNIVNNVLLYDSKQNLSDFKKRSEQINDDDFIIRQYSELKIKEIMPKYLFAMKGRYPLRSILNRLWPHYRKNIWKSYTSKQMLINLRLMNDERRREDLYYVWKYLLDNYNQNGK